MTEESPKDELRRLNRLYVFLHSAEYKEILEPMLRNFRAEAQEILNGQATPPEDPNRIKIHFIDEFFLNLNQLMEDRLELESELKKDSETKES